MKPVSRVVERSAIGLKRKGRIVAVFAMIGIGLVSGCSSSEKAEGYDAASQRAAENLAKAGNDISKISEEDREALRKAAGGYPGGGGVQAPGSGAPPAGDSANMRRDSGKPPGYGTTPGG